MDAIDFDSAFEALTDKKPFPWQRALYQRFLAGEFPPSCNLPTGLGKTSVIHIWLLALANAPDRVPRRLVYVVNRRTVVDQSTVEAEKLRDAIGRVNGLSDRLQSLCADPDGLPLAISTLRGQFADNREWSADPARPAVIAGTVDMIGSRLLFSGYGVGFKMKPLHAGFLGHDALLVHDEAHLEPAFQALIEAIRDEQGREPVPLGGRVHLRVMALTATSRAAGGAFGLGPEDHNHPEIQRRIGAMKALSLHENTDEKKLADQLAELALNSAFHGRAVLVFARTVENVEKVADKLRKAKHVPELLTGTMRGKERDELVERPTFRRFLPGAKEEEKTAYVVCTSAGEVGVNISADHLVCDLSTFDSMAQRFGRVNRFGLRNDTRIEVVYPKELDEKNDYEARQKRTLELLELAKGDGSPANLSKLHEKAVGEGSGAAALSTDRTEELRKYILATYAPQPVILPTTDILFDAWALTTIREKLPGRPPVADWLHGVEKAPIPETHVAWRKEVELVGGELLDEHRPADLLEDYPLKPHELLGDRSDRVFRELVKIADRHPDLPAWLLDAEGAVEVMKLKELADKDNKRRIEYRTVILPEKVGGLEGGLLKGESVNTTSLDVADEWFVDKDRSRKRRERRLEKEPRPTGVDGMRLVREIDLRPEGDEGEGGAEDDQQDGNEEEKGRYWRWYVRPRSADDDGPGVAQEAVKWDVHTRQVIRNATRIGDALRLPAEVRQAVEFAARCHDLGKRREVWQRSIGNTNPKEWYEKPGKAWKRIELTFYRHEFGSLIDYTVEAGPGDLNGAVPDLARHLIAAHHGRARPHFPEGEAFDPEPKEGWTEDRIAGEVAEVPRRFARLQRKYGRWGLAYLESLLRAADHAASARPELGEVAP